MHPAGTARLLATAAIRAPFTLFWGPSCVIRRAAEGFFWDDPPFAPVRRCVPMHEYRIVCEPPCYSCNRRRGCHG